MTAAASPKPVAPAIRSFFGSLADLCGLDAELPSVADRELLAVACGGSIVCRCCGCISRSGVAARPSLALLGGGPLVRLNIDKPVPLARAYKQRRPALAASEVQRATFLAIETGDLPPATARDERA
jgi:hypothetical protein